MTINESDLHFTLKDKLTQHKISQFTPIQEGTIPLFLQKINFLGLASTGSGKTLAFLLPVITNIIKENNTSTLIVTPTRELANQIYKVAQLYTTKTTDVKPLLLIGGTSVKANQVALKQNPRLIIGTPGRIKHNLDLICKLSINTLIFDEVDEMLSIGFKDEFNLFMSTFATENTHQIFFSATLPGKTKQLLLKYLPDLKIVDLTTPEIKPSITEDHIKVCVNGKPQVLIDLVEQVSSALIFVNTKHECRNIQKILKTAGIDSRILNGDLSSSQRARAIRDFTNLNPPFLIATDVAARGLDFKDLPVVINYDVPTLADSYIHRIGRTGRSGTKGTAYTLIYPKEQIYIDRIKNFMSNNELIKDDVRKRTSRSTSANRPFFGKKPMYPKRISHFKNEGKGESRYTKKHTSKDQFSE